MSKTYPRGHPPIVHRNDHPNRSIQRNALRLLSHPIHEPSNKRLPPAAQVRKVGAAQQPNLPLSIMPLLTRRIASLRESLANWARPWLEGMGIAKLSRPALNQLDLALARLIPERNGWFVEAGAHDGFSQSNTYYLARFKGWRGVLIEPVPELADQCRKRRPESLTVNCALGAPHQEGRNITLREAGLMTAVCGALGPDDDEKRRALQGRQCQGLSPEERLIEVRTHTLTTILQNTSIPTDFDLLSLDVEGYEVEVLQGLDFGHYRPKAICIEVRKSNLEKVACLLDARYQLIATLHENPYHGDYFWKYRD